LDSRIDEKEEDSIDEDEDKNRSNGRKSNKV
jgi:hypothetical protein